jgi:pilus assembly protein Flp/PilA
MRVRRATIRIYVGLRYPALRRLPVISSFFAREDGQGLVEYALILVLIAIVVIGILTLLGGQVSKVFSRISSGLEPAQ